MLQPGVGRKAVLAASGRSSSGTSPAPPAAARPSGREHAAVGLTGDDQLAGARPASEPSCLPATPRDLVLRPQLAVRHHGGARQCQRNDQ